MTVPFEKLAVGQSGRLVYQVMGKSGPVFNPTGIRYLDPGTTCDRDPVSETDLAAGLSGLNLLVSAGTLALSAATYRSIQQLHGKVDLSLALASQMAGKINQLMT